MDFSVVSTGLVVILDADFIGVNKGDLLALIQPVRDGVCAFTQREPDTPDFRPLAGVRCYKTDDIKPYISKT